ncbi:hypothetical protein QZH41_016628 [Actinostola sp. cb2023]|nr:hypothetical protein QZH41_016628 [Actinostola sp. cb2023]
MNRKIEIKIKKVVNAGHFKASPIATPGSEFENFMGQLNDYFLHEKDSYGSSVVPVKGKLYVIQRTMDKCWYRARIQNIMQTTAGPQASVLLVDVGEQTLIPFSRTRELPKEFENIPYQVMDCHLIAVQPLSLVTSYFDLTTTKQVSNNWTEAATAFVLDLIHGCKLQVTIQREDEHGKYHVLLHAESPHKQVCVNDELVQKGFAVFTEIGTHEDESPAKTERRKLQQEKFIQQQEEVVDAFKKHTNIPFQDESTSTDEETLSPIRIHRIQADPRQLSPLNYLRQQVAGIREPKQTIRLIPAGSETTELSNSKVMPCYHGNSTGLKEPQDRFSLSSDDNSGRVRFVSARIPATGSGLSREDDTARLKSILKTGKSPSHISPPEDIGRVPYADVTNAPPWYPGRVASQYFSHLEEKTQINMNNALPQYPGTDKSSHYPGRAGDVSPHYPGRSGDVSPHYPGRSGDVSPHYPGRSGDVSPHYPGRSGDVSPHYPGRSGDISPHYPGRSGDVSPHYPGRSGDVSPHYPGRATEERTQPDMTNISPHYPGRATEERTQPDMTNISPHYPGRATEERTRPDMTNVSPHYPGWATEERTQPDMTNVSPHYPGRATEERTRPDMTNVSPHYPGRATEERMRPDMTNVSPHYPGRATEERMQPDMTNISPHYPGRATEERMQPDMTNISPHYPGRATEERMQPDMTNISPHYPGRATEERMQPDMTKVSPHYPGRATEERTQPDMTNVSPHYPGRATEERTQPDMTNVSPHYPGRGTEERMQPDMTNVSPHYPGRATEERMQPDMTNVSPHYPGRATEERMQPDMTNISPHYPGRATEERMQPDMTNVSPHYPGRATEERMQPDMTKVSPHYPGRATEERTQPDMTNVSPHYPGRATEERMQPDMTNISPHYPGRATEERTQPDMTNISPHYPGRGTEERTQPDMTNVSPNYTGRTAEDRTRPDMTNLSPQYPPQSTYQYDMMMGSEQRTKVNNLSPQYPGRAGFTSSTAIVQDSDCSDSSSISYGSFSFSKPSQRLPSQISGLTYSNQHPTAEHRKDCSTTSSRLPSEALTQGSRLPSEALTQGSRLPSEAFTQGSRLPSEALTQGSRLPSEALTQGSRLPSEAFTQGSRLPSEALTQGSRLPSEALTQGSRLPSEALTQGSRLPSEALTQGSRLPSEALTQGSRLPSEALTEGSRLPSEALTQGSRLPSEAFTQGSRLPSEALTQGSHLPSEALFQSSRLPSEVMDQKSSPTSQPCESESSIDDGVLIHGEGAPRPFLSIDNCPLYEKGSKLDIKKLTPIQRHMWPALLRGRDVAGIAPRNTGKKLAYLLPIIDQVMEPSTYSELPLTNGPLAVILCSSWSKAIDVYQECKKIIGKRRTARVHVIFGGGAEEEQIVSVLNGCEILVATVPCFLRMLTHNYTPLDRLCHIVFDDADILVEDFTSELKDIMRVYGRHLVSKPGRIAPRQAVIMASTWTVGVASLTRAYLGNPLIIIDDKVEAAIYSGVKHTVELCSTNQRLTRLLGFLDHADKTHEIVVFTNTAQEAETLGEVLGTNNYFVLVAHEFLNPPTLADIRRQWYTPHTVDLMPILVMTDGVLMGSKLTIHNASMVIHYDLPQVKNKEKFGRRFYCMAHTFSNVKAKERDKVNAELCDFLLAYGTCRTFADKKKCAMRHVVLKEEDYPYDLPTMGTVKVLVLYVMNATCLWVRILEHRNPKGETIPYHCNGNTKFLQMTIDMGMWYGNVANRKKVDMARMSDMCAIEEDGSYHRVKVCDIVSKQPQSGLPLEAQAVQVFVCRVKPQDKGLQWTPKANSFVKHLVEGKELEGRVTLSLGNTMWLDPLWERKVLKSINVTTNINNIRIELLKNGLATENKHHMKQLRKLCEDVIDLSIYDGTGASTDSKGYDSSTSLETVTLTDDDYQDVYVSAVDTPGLFFVQLAMYKTKLEELQTQIDRGINSVQYEDDDEISIGSLCVACFTNNNVWYRARVLGIRPDNEYDVFYVDYGDREWIPRSKIRPAWPDILTLPLQGIECSLVNIIPLENNWTNSDGNVLWDMSEERLLFVKVKSKVASLMSGCHRFVVELVDTSSSIDVIFSEELVATGHAQTSPEGIQTLFPEATVQLERQEYKYEFEKIPDMCRDILQSRDPSQRLGIAKSLQTLVLNSINAKDAVREGGGVRSICRLLALTRLPAVQEHLLVSLECLTFQNDRVIP